MVLGPSLVASGAKVPIERRLRSLVLGGAGPYSEKIQDLTGLWRRCMHVAKP